MLGKEGLRNEFKVGCLKNVGQFIETGGGESFLGFKGGEIAVVVLFRLAANEDIFPFMDLIFERDLSGAGGGNRVGEGVLLGEGVVGELSDEVDGEKKEDVGDDGEKAEKSSKFSDAGGSRTNHEFEINPNEGKGAIESTKWVVDWVGHVWPAERDLGLQACVLK